MSFLQLRSLKVKNSIGYGTSVIKYSQANLSSLTMTDADLAYTFTAPDINLVATDDATYRDLGFDNIAVILFKYYNLDPTKAISVTWNGKSSIAPSVNQVVMQIYNRTDVIWETLASDSTTAATTDFTLSGTQSTNLTKYYDSNGYVAVRVYQIKI